MNRRGVKAEADAEPAGSLGAAEQFRVCTVLGEDPSLFPGTHVMPAPGDLMFLVFEGTHTHVHMSSFKKRTNFLYFV